MFKAGWYSCKATNSEVIGNYTALNFGAKVIFSLGDNPYMDIGSISYGYSTLALDKDSTVEDFTEKYDQAHNTSASAKAKAQADYYMMFDDHEWGGDNWDHTVTQANSGTSIGAVTQADVDTHWYRGIQAFRTAIATYANNPTNSDAEAVAEAPSEADASASQYPVNYFRVGYDVDGKINNTSPHVEFFVLDCISYRDPLTDTDNAAKTMLGKGTGGGRDTDGQYYWLVTRLAASTATFKVIVSGKKTYTATADNADTWNRYTTERDLILAYIDASSITGVMWMSGDKHHPHVIATEKPGDTYDHLCIVACPVGVDTNSLALENEIVWKHDAKVIGMLEINQNYIEAKIMNNASGKVYSRWRLNAGSNKQELEPLKVSI